MLGTAPLNGFAAQDAPRRAEQLQGDAAAGLRPSAMAAAGRVCLLLCTKHLADQDVALTLQAWVSAPSRRGVAGRWGPLSSARPAPPYVHLLWSKAGDKEVTHSWALPLPSPPPPSSPVQCFGKKNN